MRITDFSTANLLLILGFKSYLIWWIRVVIWRMLRTLWRLKSLARLTQMINFTTLTFSLDIMVETFLAWLAQLTFHSCLFFNFNQCDPSSEIITASSSSLSELIWVTTLICFGGWEGGGVTLKTDVSADGVSLHTTFLGLRWWRRLDSDISINSTLSNQFLCLSWGRHTEVMRLSNGQLWGW